MNLDILTNKEMRQEAEPDINVGGFDGEIMCVEVKFDDDEQVDLDKAFDLIIDTFAERDVEIDIDLISEQGNCIYYEVTLNRYYE